MLRLGICDSEEGGLRRLEKLAARLPFRTACECFSDSAALLRFCMHSAPDVALLDVSSDAASLGCAQNVRAALGSAALILTAADARCITRAFCARPDQFLLKPVRDEDFFEAMQTVLRQGCRQRSTVRFAFRSGRRLITLRQDEISYLEARGHYVQVNSAAEKPFLIAGTIGREEKRLAPYHFVKVHRSYLVNLHHVRCIEGRDAVMKSGERIPVSKGRFRQLCEQYAACAEADLTETLGGEI